MTFTLKNKSPLLPVIFLGLLAAIGVGCGGGGGGGTPPPVAPTTFTVGGSISGLSNTGFVLQNNGGDDLNISAANATFTFATVLNTNDAYAVSIATQPFGQNCTVSNASGTIANANISDVVINCTLTDNDPSGLYNGTGTGIFVGVNGGAEVTLSKVKGMANTSRFIFFNADVTDANSNVLYDGTITLMDDTTLTGTVDVYQGGQIVASGVNVTGSMLNSRSGMQLTFAASGNFGGGTVDGTFDTTEFDKGAADAVIDTQSNMPWGSGLNSFIRIYMKIAGMMTQSFIVSRTDNTYQMNIFNSGNINDCFLRGGKVGISNATANLYTISGDTISGSSFNPTCTDLNGTTGYTGFAAVVDDTIYGANNGIWYAITNGTYSIFTILART